MLRSACCACPAVIIFSISSLLTSSLKAAEKAPELSALDINRSIEQGVNFLVSHQNKNGSWGNATRTKGLNIYAPVPDAHQAFRTASSALALHGLLECRDQRPATLKAIERGEAWLLETLPNVRNIDPRATYSIWAHAYSLRALASLYRYHDDPAKREEYRRQAAIQIKRLVRHEDVNKGWGYYDFQHLTAKPSGSIMSFTTATALLAMHDVATAMNIELPATVIKRGVQSIQMQRNPDFSYMYSFSHRWTPRRSINTPAGSLGRSQACNAALRKFGDSEVTDTVIRTWLQRLFDRQGWLDHGRKRPVPHEAPAAVSGYFYFYGHYYASECIPFLPAQEQQKWKQKLSALIISKQEKNGCWWDYPL
ncbi:MAG: hypothetical protein GWP68_08150, partial [Verrucomicrobiaceae bacterium]|nr:hypothetical protein [Verrucomicrobiaceae bacterium]